MSGVHGAAQPALVDPGERAAPEDDSQTWGYYVGGCGHPAPIPPNGRVVSAGSANPSRPAVPDLRLPAGELYSIDVLASVDTVSWWFRLCDHEATAASAPAADTAAVRFVPSAPGCGCASSCRYLEVAA